MNKYNTKEYVKLWEKKEKLGNIPYFLLDLVGKNKRVLELGCSTGYMSKLLSEKYSASVTGVEIDPNAAKLAKKYCNNVIVGNLDDPKTIQKIKNIGKFDVILMADIIEHLANPFYLLKELRNSLDVNGYVIIFLPNVAYYSIRLMLLRGNFKYENHGILDKTHLRFYTFYTAKELVESAGYKINMCKGYGFGFPFGRLSKVPVINLLYNLITKSLSKYYNIFSTATLIKAN